MKSSLLIRLEAGNLCAHWQVACEGAEVQCGDSGVLQPGLHA